MKTRYFISILLSMLLGIGTFAAQNTGRLYIPDLTALPGNTLSVPVYVENTTEIVAVQFTLQVPEGATLTSETAALTNRAADHTVTLRTTAPQEYLCVVYSPTNSPIKGRTGKLMTIDMPVPSSYAEGSTLALTLKDAVLSLRDGSNVLSSAEAGTISIAKAPDLSIQNVLADKTTIAPGEALGISWQVQNVGGVETGDGWTEQISLVQADGTSVLLGTTYYDDTLSPSGTVSRQATVTLPQVLGLDGQAKVQVQIVPWANTGESEGTRGNNTATTATAVNVGKLLALALPTSSIEETYAQPIRCTLTRSGNRTQEQTFTLTATADSRLTIPTEVTIPAGQSAASFYILIKDNTTLDDGGLVTITASGNDYEAVSGQFTIEDDEYPDLTLTASKSEVTEGESFQLTITASRASAAPLEVTLTSENSKRFSFPTIVTIPAGETSTQVTVQVIDDELPSLDLTNSFTASAPGYNTSEVLVILKDNDLPVLELTLTPTTVSEGAGVVAVAGVLKRTTNTNNKITVKLTDDAEGGLYFANRTLELAKGVEEVHFNFGPVDNALVDGNCTYTITAAVWLSSCNCGTSGESAGYVTAQLQVLDNDGAALNLTSSQSTVKEGGKTTLTISRNTTDNVEPLAVILQSDYDENLTYNHTVTIPAGQTSTTIEVTSNGNDVQGDNHTVVFTAQAEGYATGTCYLMVTDQTLPDAIIEDISIIESAIKAGETATVSVRLANRGTADLPSSTQIDLFILGHNSPFSTISSQTSIAPGETEIVTRKIIMPTITGDQKLYAVVNNSRAITEVQYSNNASDQISICLLVPYFATVCCDKKTYLPGETVNITGTIDGEKKSNSEVEIYLINDGIRQSLFAHANDVGEFSLSYMPPGRQLGHFMIGACYPNSGQATEQDSFDYIGLRRTTQTYITCEVIVGTPYKGTIQIENPTNITQHNVRAEIIEVPENCEVSISPIMEMPSGGRYDLNYTIDGKAPSASTEWKNIKLRLVSDEGASTEVVMYCYCRLPQAQLSLDISQLNTTITKGIPREYPISITNIGAGETGRISLSLPSILQGTSVTFPSLKPDEKTTITLHFETTDDMQLNVPITGMIGINCENGNGVGLPFSLLPVSDAKGVLIIDVCDEYTYYTTEAPHVKGAKVTLKHPYSNQIIADGITGDDGTFSAELPEGFYSISVSADKHESYQNNILIDPGRETLKVVNLSYEAIKVEWKVEETEVDDEYNIQTTLTYETNVPEPVVITNLPDYIPVDSMAPGESRIYYATLTNKGLIAAESVQLLMPEVEYLTFEPLIELPVKLLPEQSIFVPFKVTLSEGVIAADDDNYPESTKSFRKIRKWKIVCETVTKTVWLHWCGNDHVYHHYETPIKLSVKDNCHVVMLDGDNKEEEEKGGIPDGSGGFLWIGGRGGQQESPTHEEKGCRTCLEILLDKVKDKAIGAIPIFGCWINSARCTKESIDRAKANNVNVPDFKTMDCELEVLQCTLTKVCDAATSETIFGPAVCEAISSIKNVIEALIALTELKDCFWISLENNNARRVLSDADVPSFVKEMNSFTQMLSRQADAIIGYNKELFGEDIWLNTNLSELYVFLDELYQHNDRLLDVNALSSYKPTNITQEQLEKFISRLNNTFFDQDNELGGRIDFGKIEEYIQRILNEENHAISLGYISAEELWVEKFKNYKALLYEGSNSVCASVSLQIEQTMTLTRPAYRGTLTVFNGHEDTPMEDVKLTLSVSNMATGQIATSHEFQINIESLDGFIGKLDLGNGWTLGADKTGKATVLFIPTKFAAPTEPVEWSFGGTLSYIDPFTGLRVSRNLIPVSLTVKPLPDLELTYFMQRDVYGDDPLTADVTEPMQPAEFALIINNKGYGEAKNVRMQTKQPRIIDNEKGLLIDFNIKSSQVNGNTANLSFGQTILNEFGTIPAHSQAYAQWWLESTLLGHFTSYEVAVNHVTSYGNQDLSLVDTVTIHEMTHGFTTCEGLRGYLVNDIADANDLPDIIYFTDATQQEVSVVKNTPTITKQSNKNYLLTITPSQTGWNYGYITDPTFGRSALAKIIRQGDGKELPLDNFWQTDRTLRDGKEWLYENKLHFVDQMANSTETYLLTFEPRPDVELQVASFDGIPEENVVLHEPLQSVTVTFNKAIDASTFTAEDITLRCQGKAVEGSIGITPVSDTQFTLDLSQLTAGNGYYVLTIQTADITDFEGFNGAAGKTATWIQFTEATTLALSFYDAEVTYGNSFTEPRILTNSPAVPTFTSTNPLVASVSTEGRVTINAVGTTQVNVALEETPMSDAAQTSYRLTVLQPEGSFEAPAGIETVNITIPEGQTMTTFCSPWPIDFSDATNDCRAYMAFTYSEDIVECAEVVEAKGGAGLLIVGKPGTYTFPVRTSFYDPIENLFVGTLAPTYVEEMNDDKTNLGLKDIKFVPLNAGVIKANTAYLPIAMDDNVDAMTIVLKAMTGLRIITEQFDEVPWFNISGMKVSRPSAKGIYIHNGRKVVVQ